VAEKRTITEVWWEKQAMKPRKQDSSVGLVGQWDITVLDDGRIKLPADVLRMLQSLGLSSYRLCPGRIPREKALVLCPEQFWDRWKEALLSQFPLLKTHRGAAAFINPFKPIGWDTHGRISLPAPACYYAGIGKGVPIILVGKDYYMELRTEEEFMKAFEDCKAALAETNLRQPKGNGPVGDCRIENQGGAL